jgi:hypothetical protein
MLFLYKEVTFGKKNWQIMVVRIGLRITGGISASFCICYVNLDKLMLKLLSFMNE